MMLFFVEIARHEMEDFECRNGFGWLQKYQKKRRTTVHLNGTNNDEKEQPRHVMCAHEHFVRFFFRHSYRLHLKRHIVRELVIQRIFIEANF